MSLKYILHANYCGEKSCGGLNLVERGGYHKNTNLNGKYTILVL